MASNLSKIAVLVSGSGTNLQKIIDDTKSGRVAGQVALIVSDREDAYALERGKTQGIPSFYIRKDPDRLLEVLKEHQIELIVLAGYLSILEIEIVDKYPNRIINIHPSLIPKYCGKGFYGIHVHSAVIKAGEQFSGATVHFVDKGIDTGPIILQQQIAVLQGDTPQSLQKRVLEVEHEILPKAINFVIESWGREQS